MMKKLFIFGVVMSILAIPASAEFAHNTLGEYEDAPATPYFIQNENSEEVDLNYKYSESKFENEDITPAVNNRKITEYTKPPVWEDYIPEKYQNPRRDFSAKSATTELVAGIVLTDLLLTAPIGIPMIVHSTTKFKNINYAKKKDKFNEGLIYAQSIENPTERRVYYKTLLKNCDMTEAHKNRLAKKRAKQAAKHSKIRKQEIEKINEL